MTKINHVYAADSWFPNLDETGEWEITGESEEQTYFDLEYTLKNRLCILQNARALIQHDIRILCQPAFIPFSLFKV